MESFTKLTAIAAPLLRANVDTDVIIRIEHLIRTDKGALGRHCFEAWRYHADGSENLEFVLNREPYRGAKILLNGPNFGCGSSREAAVWALSGIGIRCVIAPSFGDIFHNNCLQNGMLPIMLPMATIQALADEVAADPANNLVVIDLAAQTVTSASGRRFAFEIDPMRRDALLQGLDDVGLSLKREAEIAAFQTLDRAARPWVYSAG